MPITLSDTQIDAAQKKAFEAMDVLAIKFADNEIGIRTLASDKAPTIEWRDAAHKVLAEGGMVMSHLSNKVTHDINNAKMRVGGHIDMIRYGHDPLKEISERLSNPAPERTLLELLTLEGMRAFAQECGIKNQVDIAVDKLQGKTPQQK